MKQIASPFNFLFIEYFIFFPIKIKLKIKLLLLMCRFQMVAYLQQMWWVEAVGELEFEFPRGSYSLYFRLQLGKAYKRLGRRLCNFDQVHGWDAKPVRFQLSTSDGQHAVKECYLNGPGEWIYYHVGDFVIETSIGPTKLTFSLAQIDCTHTKGGLCIDCAVICPSEFRERLKGL